MSIRILKMKTMATSVETSVHGEENAHYLEEQAKKAGFDKVVVKKTSGDVGENFWQVIIDRKPGGTMLDIVAFLKSHPDVDYREEE